MRGNRKSEVTILVTPKQKRILEASVAALQQDDRLLTEDRARRYVRVVLAAFRAESAAIMKEEQGEQP